MPDSKITALASIGTGTDPAVDPLVIVDVSDTTMAASGTTKKVTLNNLLASSPTAGGNFTITGNLTVDTNTLFVDAANNRVGVGTATPQQTFEVVGGTAGINTIFNTGSAGDSRFELRNNNVRSGYVYWDTAEVRLFADTSRALTFYQNGTLGMTLNSTGLGVGVSPLAKIHSSTNVAAANFDWTSAFTAPTVGLLATSNNSSAWIRVATLDSNPTHDPYVNFLTSGGQNWSVGIDNSDSDKFKIALTNGFTGSNEFVTIDTTGNLILQPSATPATLTTNGQLTVNATSNTNLRFSYRGSDGVTRVANITLA